MLASKFPVSEVTINKAYNEIIEYKYILLDDDLTNKIVILMENIRKHIKRPKHLEEKYKSITGNIIEPIKEESMEYSINSIDFVDKINTLMFKLYETMYETNKKYYTLINNLKK